MRERAVNREYARALRRLCLHGLGGMRRAYVVGALELTF